MPLEMSVFLAGQVSHVRLFASNLEPRQEPLGSILILDSFIYVAFQAHLVSQESHYRLETTRLNTFAKRE